MKKIGETEMLKIDENWSKTFVYQSIYLLLCAALLNIKLYKMFT